MTVKSAWRFVLLLLMVCSIGMMLPPVTAWAQTTCPPIDRQSPSIVPFVLVPTAGDICTFFSGSPSQYDLFESSTTDFLIALPDDNERSGASYPVKINVENAANRDLPVTSIMCPGGSVGGVGTGAGTVVLPDGGSCALYVYWDNGDKDISFSGAVLSRSGNRYALSAGGVIRGDDFGGIAAPPSAEIDIFGKDVLIANGDTSPSFADNTNFGLIPASVTVTKTFTITNSGNVRLNLIGTPRVRVEGANRAHFSVNTNGTSSVILPGGRTTFNVTFKPRGAGVVSRAVIGISSTRGDYTFAIQGEGAPQEFDVSSNGRPIADGSTAALPGSNANFGTIQVANGAVAKTFTITNTGGGALNLSGTPRRVRIGGTNASDFTVTTDAATPVAANGGTTSFTITFDPSAAGARTATVSIAGDDTDENPYTFAIQGQGSSKTFPVVSLRAPAVFKFNEVNRFTLRAEPAPDAPLVAKFRLTSAAGAVAHEITGGNLGKMVYSVPFRANQTEATFELTPTLPNGAIVSAGGAVFVLVEPSPNYIAGSSDPSQIGFDLATVLRAAIVSASFDPKTVTEGFASTLTITGRFAATTAADRAAFLRELAELIKINGTAGDTDYKLSDLTLISMSTVAGFRVARTVTATRDSEIEESETVTVTVADEAAMLTIADGPSFEPQIAVTGNGRVIAVGDPTPSVDDHTDFGTVETANGAVDRTFTITNTGNLELKLTGTPRVTISGAHAGDFAATNPASPIAADGAARFTITFDPSAAGARTATVTIASNDADENPYTFTIQGEGAQPPPEIEVSSNAVPIADGDTSPSIADNTNFGPIEVANGTVAKTFTITNTGGRALNLSGTPRRVGIGGANASDFTVTTDAATPVAANGGTTSFTITFDPSAVGARTATVTIASNDADENPYTFAIQGGGAQPVPEIDVSGNGITIVDGDTAPATADNTSFGSIEVANGTVAKTFTITNMGGGALNLGGTPRRVDIGGANASDFTVTTDAATPVAANGGTTSFTITFDPSAVGARTATVTIASNDADENPYTFAIQGGGAQPVPEIDVSGNGITIADGDTAPATADNTRFGSIEVANGTVAKTFTITNMGGGALNLDGTPRRVGIGGANASDFTVTTDAATPVAANGGTTSFTITFDPSAVGARTATVTIASNDADENPYTFAIQGGGAQPVPEIDVSGNGITIVDGDTAPATADNTSFGSIEVANGTVAKTFTITNMGGGALNLGGTPRRVGIGGANASDFTVTTDAATPVAANGGTTSFTITFDPSAVGARTATVTIASNDADENPYTFAIQGGGAQPVPEIDVSGNGITIVDGDTAPATADNTSFGSIEVANGTVAKTFTITNMGGGALNLGGTPRRVGIGGANASDFTVTTDAATPVAANGGTTSFTITFDPSAVGARTATVTIASNDADENPYTFAIQGGGAQPVPEIDVSGNGITIVDGDTAPATADNTRFGSIEVANGTVAKTFTITNMGGGALNLDGTPRRVDIGGTNASDFTVTTDAATPVAANGGTTSFTITFDPSAVGARTATVTIASNDADENPYTFAIQGGGAQPVPEIDVSGNGITIVDGDTAPATADNTSFGSIEVANGTVAKTFTITNMGGGALNLGGTPRRVGIGGANASDFTVTTDAATPVAANGGTTSFTITFDPSAVGARTATVSIASNDADENPYTFAIQGGGAQPVPDIDVSGNGITIVDGDTAPATADNTRFGSIEVANGTVAKTFTITNMGGGALNLGGTPRRVGIGGANASDFTVTTDAATPVAANGGTTSFTITFDPSAVGARTATVTIASNDADENPYTFAIQGEGTQPVPDIDVSGNGVAIADGDTSPATADNTDFGRVGLSGSTSKTFTITNTGGAALILNARVRITGANASDFTVTTDATTPVAADNGTTSFTVTFEPSAGGARRATVTIASNDADENMYTFAIQGAGTQLSAIYVSGNATLIANGDRSPSPADNTNFGRVALTNGTVAKTFTISNSGGGALILSGTPRRVHIGGTNASDFALTTDATTPVAANGGATSFTITFDPSAAGTRRALVSIANNDADEKTYTFAIQGDGDGSAVVQRTRRIISNFMRRRADQITANDPDLTNRLGNGNAEGGRDAASVTGQGSARTHRFAFATSLRQAMTAGDAKKNRRRAALGRMMALGTHNASGNKTPASGFDIWAKATRSKIDNETAATDFGLVTVAADYRLNSDLVVGFMTQFDWTDEKDRTQNFKIDGRGWMVGPYVVTRLHENLIFDGRAAWGQSSNTVSPFSTYTDDFDTQRWLVKGQLTGAFQFGAVHVAPHVGVIYFEEQQKGYTDSLGNTIGQQKVELGRATFGPKVSASYQSEDGMVIAPFVSIKGIWDFKSTDAVNSATGLAGSATNSKLRARTEAGISVRLPTGMSIAGEGFYDGIGADNFSAYGGSVTVKLPF